MNSVQHSASFFPLRYLTLPLLMVGLVGCFGGSSSSSGDSNGTGGSVSLTEEEQVLGAAVMGIEQVGAARDFAQGQTETPEDPTDDGSNGAGTTSVGVAGTNDEVELLFDCPNAQAPAQFTGEGQIRVQEGSDYLDISNQSFPSGPFSGRVPESGAANDVLIRANCVLLENGEEIYRYQGALNAAQQENIDGTGARAVHARMGGFSGSGEEDHPDTGQYFETAAVFDGEHMNSRFRGELFTCEGCIGGDLSNFAGNPALDATSHSFLDMELQFPGGVRVSYQVGAGPEAPFTMQTSDQGNGQAAVYLEGLLSHHDQESGCGFDVTYATRSDLLLDDYASDDPQTVGGEIDVTMNESGNTYSVAYHANGDVTVQDEAGNTVTPQLTEDAMRCGYFTGEPAAPGTPEPASLEGTWKTACTRVTEDLWGTITVAFSADGSGTQTAAVFSNDACTTSADDPAVTTFSYATGPFAGATNGTAAFEIDFTHRETDGSPAPDIFEIYGIEGNQLYYGEPMAGPDAPEHRPEELDFSVGYTRQ